MIKYISIYHKTYTYLYNVYNIVIFIVLEFGICFNDLIVYNRDNFKPLKIICKIQPKKNVLLRMGGFMS